MIFLVYFLWQQGENFGAARRREVLYFEEQSPWFNTTENTDEKYKLEELDQTLPNTVQIGHFGCGL